MTAYFVAPPGEVWLEFGPLIVPPDEVAPGDVVPLAPGDVVELCGAELLPDELSQSFIAASSLLLLMPVPVLLVPLLAPGVLEAELLPPGGQSLLDRPREAPDVPDVAPALLPVVVPLVPALVPDLLPAPVVLLVCAIAAVPRVSATIDAAVRRRRFIRCPPCECGAPAGRKALGDAHRLTAGCGGLFRLILKVELPAHATLPAANCRRSLRFGKGQSCGQKKKGRTRGAAQVQGGKARRTCSALRRTGLAPHSQNRRPFIKKWLMATSFFGVRAFFLGRAMIWFVLP
jgi:hypothetical protein